jgi:hypothetical protein
MPSALDAVPSHLLGISGFYNVLAQNPVVQEQERLTTPCLRPEPSLADGAQGI